jgi:hypothetical protein
MPDASHDDPIAVNSFTVLRMQGIGVPPYSARGLSQSLEPIQQASQLRRTVNGNLRDLAFDGFKKYSSSISGTDQRPPNFDGRWPGLTVIVDCIAELSYTPDEGDTPQRDIVPGSERVEGAHNVYRPRLTMKIINLSVNVDEYECQTGWTLELEEI